MTLASSHHVPPYHPALLGDLESETAEIYMLLGELRSLTRWSLDVLCQHLGCDATRRPSDVTAEQLTRHSVAYLSWVTELCNLVDRPVDRHDILFGAYELVAGAGGRLDDKVPRCARACEVAVAGQPSARQLIKIGEISSAWIAGAMALDTGPARERADRLSGMRAPLADLTSHLHPRRLALLFSGPVTRDEELGPTVARRMREHLVDCKRCENVVRELGLYERAAAQAA